MQSYSQFSLSQADIDKVKMRNFRRKVQEYITINESEPSDSVARGFYDATAAELEEYRKILYALGSDVPSDPLGGHSYVDLGLSVMWATCNIGATNPEDIGDFFAWGEVEAKNEFTFANYKWNDGSFSYTKYNNTDHKTTLDLEDDAAHVLWGGPWRLPSSTDITQMRSNTDCNTTMVNGVECFVVTSRINGNSIIIPRRSSTGDGYSFPMTDFIYSGQAFYYNPGSGGGVSDVQNRYYRFTVRPVFSASSLD